jgi:hypothetical protein
MPRTRKSPPGPLSPAVRFFLMLGVWPPTMKSRRVVGWVGLSEWIREGAAARNAADAYADELTEEAAGFDFVPWMVSGRRPHGPGVNRWYQAFLDDSSNWY